MYASRFTQFVVGIFALAGIAALVYLSVRLGNVGIFPVPGYTLYANFDNVAGLKTGDLVELAGVTVGKVQVISLLNNRAHVGLRINNGVDIDTDAIAAVKTSGIIGDKYVSIALGAGEHDLTNGGTIRQTQSAFVLEDAIGQLINNSGSGSSNPSASNSEANGRGSSGNNPLPSIGQSASSGDGNCNCGGQKNNKK
jgi:phospholipid/cholesterol/gamma-HCH transport system substrate-binding protein